MIRVVADTNVVISAQMFGGVPGEKTLSTKGTASKAAEKLGFVSGPDFNRKGANRIGLYRLQKNSFLLKGTAFRPYITALK
jgi:hypothetical protein